MSKASSEKVTKSGKAKAGGKQTKAATTGKTAKPSAGKGRSTTKEKPASPAALSASNSAAQKKRLQSLLDSGM